RSESKTDPRFGPRIGKQHIEATQRYVAERQEKRTSGMDVPEHQLHDGKAGLVKYAGVRRVDGYPMALLELEGSTKVWVLPIDEGAARRLNKVSRGQTIEVTPKAGLKTRQGRGR